MLEYELLDKSNYMAYYQIVQQSRWGNLLLPYEYDSKLWGVIVLDGDIVVGGWVGWLRGNGRFVSLLAKSVYFDSYPLYNGRNEEEIKIKIVERATFFAKQQGIVMFNLTHWVREKGGIFPFSKREQNATFTIDLSLSEEDIWKGIEPTQRNRIRKGEKNGVTVLALNADNSIAYLDAFQKLRKQTQARAIEKNANASMLLKSNDFFNRLLRQPNSLLFVGMVGEEVATVVLMLTGGKTAYYYSGGSDYELNKSTGSSALVFWRAILHYKNHTEVDCFDMGGVPVFQDYQNPDREHPAFGVFKFKRSFGGKYEKFDGGQITIAKWRYSILQFLMRQRFLLRLFSTTRL
jgi:hypothetical protein